MTTYLNEDYIFRIPSFVNNFLKTSTKYFTFQQSYLNANNTQNAYRKGHF